MTGQGEAGSASIIIGGRYRVMPEQPREGFCGLPACVVEHVASVVEQSGPPALVAVRVRPDAPPPASLQSYVNVFNTALLMPVAHGGGGGGYWVICDAPPGPSLQEVPFADPMGETELVNTVLKPLAQALNRLHASGLTHRGVRPGNLFRSQGGRILLGPGCLGPHALDQPVLYEPVGSGLCAPYCRGPGTAADDVYALGVLLLELVLGKRLLSELTDRQIVQRKLEIGSFQTLTANERVPSSLVSLLRSMLADDPQARPALSGLAENGATGERPKPSRPDPRAPRPLTLGRTQIYTARMLAYGFSRQPTEALASLRAGTVDQWLRRALEQPLIALRIEETLRTGRDRAFVGSDPALLMQVIAMLDPLAPMFWHGTWLWPDAVPSMLARMMVEGGDTAPITEMIETRALRRWCFVSGRMMSIATEEIERRNARATKSAGGLRLARLAYALNPFLACLSPHLAGSTVLGADQLLLALETKDRDVGAGDRVLDMQMLALLSVRAGADTDTASASSFSDDNGMLLDLAVLARAQRTLDPPVAGFPKLAARLLPAARERLKSWPGMGRRARRMEHLERVAQSGDLPSMLAIVEQNDARAADEHALREARGHVEALRGAHLASAEAGDERARLARVGGQDLGVAAGVLGLLVAVVAELLQ